jgi:hypothetical protein
MNGLDSLLIKMRLYIFPHIIILHLFFITIKISKIFSLRQFQCSYLKSSRIKFHKEKKNNPILNPFILIDRVFNFQFKDFTFPSVISIFLRPFSIHPKGFSCDLLILDILLLGSRVLVIFVPS